jgi:hypothetical protein
MRECSYKNYVTKRSSRNTILCLFVPVREAHAFTDGFLSCLEPDARRQPLKEYASSFSSPHGVCSLACSDFTYSFNLFECDPRYRCLFVHTRESVSELCRQPFYPSGLSILSMFIYFMLCCLILSFNSYYLHS